MGTTATKEERDEQGNDGGDIAREAHILPAEAVEKNEKASSIARSKPIAVPVTARESPAVDTWCGSEPGSSTLGPIPPLERPADDKPVAIGVGAEGTTSNRFIFVWTGEANTVAVAGSFNDWTNPVELKQVGNHRFRIELELEAKEHEYKYIVDGKWKHDPLAPVVASGLGSLNNILKLDAVDDGVSGIDALVPEDPFSGRQTPPGEYSQVIPVFDTGNPPPLLPPHLKEATLNSEPLSDDPSDLPVPNHVVLDHLYAQSVRDNELVLGATHRYRKKYVTTVLYKPL